MYRTTEIKEVLLNAKITINPVWINVKEKQERIETFISTDREFSIQELVDMVQVSDEDYENLNEKINDYIKKHPFSLESKVIRLTKEEVVEKKREVSFIKKIFEGQIMIEVKYNKEIDKFKISRVLDTLK